MIEFRLHEGRLQYRSWDLERDLETGVVTLGPFGGIWTEWRDVPIAEPNYDYKNLPPISVRTNVCGTCRFLTFSDKDVLQATHGQCRWQPQEVFKSTLEWCGQWKAK